MSSHEKGFRIVYNPRNDRYYVLDTETRRFVAGGFKTERAAQRYIKRYLE